MGGGLVRGGHHPGSRRQAGGVPGDPHGTQDPACSAAPPRRTRQAAVGNLVACCRSCCSTARRLGVGSGGEGSLGVGRRGRNSQLEKGGRHCYYYYCNCNCGSGGAAGAEWSSHAPRSLACCCMLHARHCPRCPSPPRRASLLVTSLLEMPRARKRRNHAPARASERNRESLAPALVIRKDVVWAVKKKRTVSALAAAAQLAIPNSRPPPHEALAGSSQNEGPRSESSGAGQEQLKCYTRKKNLPPCVPAAAAALPEENCEVNCEVNCEENIEENVEEYGEENSESAPSSKSPKLRGQRTSRKRREIPPPPLALSLPGTISKDDGNNGNAPEPDAPGGRPRRQRKPKDNKDYQRSDTKWYDWLISYPNDPCPPEYGDEPDFDMELGEVEAISGCEGGSSDISDNVERPMSLKSQTDTQKTRKARRILVEESWFPFVRRNVQERTEAPSVPPLVQHDESAMCLQTPEKLQESNGECEDDRNPSTHSESAPDKDTCWIPSEDDFMRNAGKCLPDSVTQRTSVPLVVELSGRTLNGSRLLQEGISFKAKVKLRKKHTRPKVKRPEKVKVAKPPKIPKIPKTSKRKNSSARGAFEHNNATSRAKGAAVREHSLHATATAEFLEPATGLKSQAIKRQRQNESAPSSKPADSALVLTDEVPHISAEAFDNSFAMSSGRNTIAGGDICIHLPILESSSGISNQQEYEDRRGQCCVPTIENGLVFEERAECNTRLEDPGRSELTIEKIPESDLQHRSCPVIRCIPNFGGIPVPEGSWMEEEPPSTPRGNALIVVPNTDPFLSSPSFSQPSFGDGDSSTDSDGEQTGPTPTRRKRSSLTQRTRRSLLSAVEAAENSLVPQCVSAPVVQPDILFFKMTETQKKKHAWALCKDPRFFEDPMGLVKELTRGTPKRFLSKLTTETNKLVMNVMDKDVGAVDPANQLVYNRRSPTAHFPLPIHSRESSVQEQLQLVVFGQKSSEMVMYQEMRPKVKYKPKVILDPMTIKTFDRLMLQGGEVKDADHADEDWVEARKLWSDRAHYFNCIMRQVQGDRTFSKWGGSLLDSVVGAFLTQNVSDFLSSNAFMELRAHFPVREDARSGSGVSSEEQSSLTEEIIPGGCPVGTSDTDLSTPQMAEENQSDSLLGSKENLVKVGIDNQQESSASPMPDVDLIQDGQVVTEVSITHTHMDTTFVEESQEAMNIFVELPSSDEVPKDPDQSNPYSFSDEDRSAETFERSIVNSDLVIALEAVQIGSTLVAQGSCSPMEMVSPSAGVPDEHVTENVDNETSPVTETISEITPEVANMVPHGGNSSKEHHSGTQADTEDGGKKGNRSDMAGGVAQTDKFSSRFVSILEDKFKRSMKDGILTPDETGKRLAATLCAILGKQTTDREAAKDQVVPLEIVKRKKHRNKRFMDMNRFKTKIKLLTGDERANYELKVSYKLNSEQKVIWEALRADVLLSKEFEKDPFTADSVDWEAVRRADVAEVANVIKERGMNNILGGRIKSLLDRIHRDQDGRLDLEWIRKLSPINAQNFLTSVRGLGLKSVECIRLLTLHHPSFPVDVNVGRIVVRLGWVPLEPLPEETQLHLLEMYPVQEQIQKYIWPRLCTLDQQTLYEFHYQLITFGKVFCTKSKPNCNACPMRSQCKHYESAYCSARPLLQGPEEASNNSMHQIEPLTSRPSMQPPLERRHSLLMLGDQARASQGACIPIIEEPNSPEYVHDIEETPFTKNWTNGETDYMEVSYVNLDFEPSPCGSNLVSVCDKESVCVDLNETPTEKEIEESSIATTTKDAVQETEGFIEDVVEEPISQLALGEEVARMPSQELVLLPPQAASFPAPPLKNVQRLRTIHYVYELPDHHPLLAKMDKRDPEDPCFYLLAIWNSDEVPEAMPKISDDDASNPFACCQPGDEAVRGTLLVPCRTAMKGSFPLNGTYFQVNEVFADHASSIVPIDVPRTLLWDLRRRFVYFGTSVTSIFKDMSQEEIQCCFKKGYICVRAFNQSTRQPRLLAARLHQSGAKIVAGRALAQKGKRASKSKDAP